jgi:hypothetical protein
MGALEEQKFVIEVITYRIRSRNVNSVSLG